MGEEFVSFLIIFPQHCHGLSTQCNNYLEVVFIPGADGRTLVSVNPPKRPFSRGVYKLWRAGPKPSQINKSLRLVPEFLQAVLLPRKPFPKDI